MKHRNEYLEHLYNSRLLQIDAEINIHKGNEKIVKMLSNEKQLIISLVNKDIE